MPTYDYRCKACDHTLELFQSMSEAPKRKCPACGRPALERQIGPGAGILFKGQGFYQTDYRSKSYQEGAKQENGGKPSDSKAKPDAKAAPKPDSAGTGAEPGPAAAKKKPSEPKAKD